METKKDFSLLRPFDLEAAKRGEKVCWYDDGEVPEYSFFTPAGNIVASFKESEPAEKIWSSRYFRMAPLAWVEGKPVYPGDRLYVKPKGGIGEEATVRDAHTDDEGDTFLDFYDRGNVWISGPFGGFGTILTWKPPSSLPPKKRKVKLLAYLGAYQLLWFRDDAEPKWPAVRVPSEDKTVEIEETGGQA